MTKAELVTSIAEKTGLTKKDSEKALAAFVDTVTETLAKGDSIQLVGFGTFEVRERAAREGINPRTNEIRQIPQGFKTYKAQNSCKRGLRRGEGLRQR